LTHAAQDFSTFKLRLQHRFAPYAGELRILAAEGLSASWMKEFEAAFSMFLVVVFSLI